jgi:hypothetical protein
LRYLAAITNLIFPVPVSPRAREVHFYDDFESSFALWEITGQGVLVGDPLNPINHALSFTGTAAGGDMWTIPLSADATATHLLTFRYLGNNGGEDSGGYLWFIDPIYGNVLSCPVFGTQPDNSNWELVDDGQWHSYSLDFQVTDFFDPIGGALQIVVEDWNGAAGIDPPDNIPGDASFYDIIFEKMAVMGEERSTWGDVKALFW